MSEIQICDWHYRSFFIQKDTKQNDYMCLGYKLSLATSMDVTL